MEVTTLHVLELDQSYSLLVCCLFLLYASLQRRRWYVPADVTLLPHPSPLAGPALGSFHYTRKKYFHTYVLVFVNVTGVNREVWEVLDRNPICRDDFQIKMSTETCMEWEAMSAASKKRF